MDEIIDKEKNVSLYNDEVMKLCDGKVKIIRYRDLANVKNIDEILKPFGACIVLVETANNYGHWVAILKYKGSSTIGIEGAKGKGRDVNTIEFFDSYGLKPDDQLKFVPEDMKGGLGSDYSYLTRLLHDCPYKVIYNKTQLQNFKKGVNTCGRWCGMRVAFKDWPLHKFISAFINSKKLTPDEWITALTSWVEKPKRDRKMLKASGGLFGFGQSFDDGMRDRIYCSCETGV